MTKRHTYPNGRPAASGGRSFAHLRAVLDELTAEARGVAPVERPARRPRGGRQVRERRAL